MGWTGIALRIGPLICSPDVACSTAAKLEVPSLSFYGWWVALTAAAGLFLGVVPIVVFSFGVFLGPITRDLHAGRGDVSFAYTLFSLIQAMSVPFAGWLMDRFGARSVIVPSRSWRA